MMNVLVFGDSIVWGAWDKEGGWVQRLKRFVDGRDLSNLEHEFCMVYNLGISGDTSRDLERFEFETKQRLKEGREMIFIFSIGINDSQFIHNKNRLRVSLENFENNIKKLINIGKKYSLKIVFVGLNPVDDSKVDPMPWAKSKSYKLKLVGGFDDKLKEVCKRENVYFIEIFEKLIKEDYKKLLEDGAHPNSRGHKRIFEIVRDFLVKNKII